MMNYLGWILTRWYFYGIIVIHFIYSASSEGQILPMSAYAGMFLGSFLVIFIIFSLVRFVFWILGGIIRMSKKR